MHPSLLLPRILALKDSSAFTVIIDSVEQSASRLVSEFLHHAPESTNVLYVNYETLRVDKRVNHEISGHENVAQLKQKIVQLTGSSQTLIVFDTLAFIPEQELFQLLFSLISKHTTVVCVYHGDLRSKTDSSSSCYPSTLSLLNYFATSILTVGPLSRPDVMPHVLEQHNNRVAAWDIPLGCNSPKFEVQLDYRRKSGRSVIATYTVDSSSHAVAIAPSRSQQQLENEADLLKGLTTFNLTTSTRNQQAKDNVELPFLESQKYGDGGVQGGAIVYQYEKDDDYDEEDPYEDPF